MNAQNANAVQIAVQAAAAQAALVKCEANKGEIKSSDWLEIFTSAYPEALEVPEATSEEVLAGFVAAQAYYPNYLALKKAADKVKYA